MAKLVYELNQSLDRYVDHHSPHGSLNYKPPISRSEIGTTS